MMLLKKEQSHRLTWTPQNSIRTSLRLLLWRLLLLRGCRCCSTWPPTPNTQGYTQDGDSTIEEVQIEPNKLSF